MLWLLEKTFGLLSRFESFDDDTYAVHRWARLKRWKRSEHAKQLRAERAERDRLRSNAMEAFKAAKRREQLEKDRAASERKQGFLSNVFELERQRRGERQARRQAERNAEAPVIEARPYERADAMRTGEELHAAWRAGKTHIPLTKQKTRSGQSS